MNPDLLDRCAAALTVLARLQLTPPDEETMDQVAGLAGQWPLSGLPQETPDAQQARENGWQLLKTSRRDGESAEHVRDDQDRLYGITARALIPPYESVHRNTDGLIFDAATLDVRSMYRRAGLRAPALGREPDDHLGLELDFLAHCCTAALDALERGEEDVADSYLAVAQEFTQEHLLTWAPAILERARGASRTRWMRGLEELTLATVLTFAQAIGAGAPAQADEGGYAIIAHHPSIPSTPAPGAPAPSVPEETA
ncbi:MAG: molecular chaperone TorD family protein [Actinomyces urogenitalis]|uniref:Cytoplasmic chaperone TorD n=4 Tax=root TaxID=1 RepID=C0W5P8_9ACTO|nr:molecular chaperone TorD family protein [Actinomyces urogenitalis]EEH65939.1 cytoplasmic chaperone TorD [Actinomyces urogenitalis DSM 15434]MBS5977642.1 molecular chaperone TorD family protein [Actinomyces urogenitalis]MBS6072719.1 molecular chaperone TorD family protein [Actinomyces urogenitalis]MDK8237301.1 molecular chaperone TorD family protein [Actinomyces urogenitalis]MDU0972707.1 molecular chaperone TorD family protein [Actinomyces urogenitalis]